MAFSFAFVVIQIENCLDKLIDLLISLFHVGCNAGMENTRNSIKLMIPKVDNADKKDSLTSVIIIRLLCFIGSIILEFCPLNNKTIGVSNRLNMNP